MFKVLGHRLSFSPLAGHLLVILCFLCFALGPTTAQFLVNGQIFTDALAIVDAPALSSVQHAGSILPIAIDVSGDGKLERGADYPGSGLTTSIDSLEIYLYSDQTNLNLTVVSNGTSLLSQEQSSTVKHLNFPLPECIPHGEYNFTIYELSHIDGTQFFSIAPIPIFIENNAISEACTEGTNPLQRLPQPSSPPPQNPLLNMPGLYPPNTSPPNAGQIPQPVMATSLVGGMTVSLTLGPSGIITADPSLPTQTMSRVTTLPSSEATVTVVFIAVDTLVTTLPGRTVGFTTVITSLATQTVTATPASDSGRGFTPLNGTLGHLRSPLFATLLIGFVASVSLLYPRVTWTVI